MPINIENRRVVIGACRPCVDLGAYAAKATVGVPVELGADAFVDGHTLLSVWARFGRGRPAATTAEELPRGWSEIALTPGYDDRWTGSFVPTRVGEMGFDIVACIDDYGSLLHAMLAKFAAGEPVDVELEEAARMVEQRMARKALRTHDQRALDAVHKVLRSTKPVKSRVETASRATTVAVMLRTLDRSNAAVSGPYPIWVDRPLAGFSAWYEMFPRSVGAKPGHSGTFATATTRFDDIAKMGFDIVYLPPIHPIGKAFRKGANNSLAAGPDDPGSPWAIGSQEGGHTDVHPDLGTMADFDRFVAQAKQHALEIALDFTLQCSPDHPWVKQHPQWFSHRPDGTIKYAENPPKKYQDVYPLDFETKDWRRLWEALRDAMLFWSRRDIRIFRVDNPHTKTLAFWQWLIAEVRKRYPETIFLCEAFTRPRVMEHLAKVGFTQSYTYFTWRNQKWELEQYLRQLATPPMVDYFRPNFWTNTPDILHEYLQTGGPPAFRVRLLLAALCAPSWGMYSGYELFENVPVRAGSEEYDHSEKYEYLPRDWHRPDSMAPMIATVNAIRRDFQLAVAQMSTLRVHYTSNDQILCVSRASLDGNQKLLIVVNLDPFSAQEATVSINTEHLALPHDSYEAHDLLDGTTYTWNGSSNYVRLDPAVAAGHVLHIRER